MLRNQLILSLSVDVLVWLLPLQQDEKTAVSPYELYQKLSTSYPSLLQPLIHERDMVWAWLSTAYMNLPVFQNMQFFEFVSCIKLYLHDTSIIQASSLDLNCRCFLSVPCMVTEEEQSCEQEQNCCRSRREGAHEWYSVRVDLWPGGLEVPRPCWQSIIWHLGQLTHQGPGQGHNNRIGSLGSVWTAAGCAIDSSHFNFAVWSFCEFRACCLYKLHRTKSNHGSGDNCCTFSVLILMIRAF